MEDISRNGPTITELITMLLDEREAKVRAEHDGLERLAEGMRSSRQCISDNLIRISRVLTKKGLDGPAQKLVAYLAVICTDLASDRISKTHHETIAELVKECHAR